MNSYNFLIYLCILLKVNKFHKHYAKAFTIQSEVSQNYHNFTHPIPRVIDWTQNYNENHFVNESISSNNEIQASKSRKKRQTLISFPDDLSGPLAFFSRLVADCYINIPLKGPKSVFMPLSVQGKANLRLPTITLPVKRSLHDRHNLYQIAMGVFDNFGIDGNSCVLRAICESSEYDLLVDGIVTEMALLILDFSFHSDDVTHEQYIEAQNFGRSGGDGGCAQKYSACEFSIFHVFDKFS
ncbi:UNVERIFIED_CONTAM: hypothetical protein RMT77_003452 [Armadillidium vulgare]